MNPLQGLYAASDCVIKHSMDRKPFYFRLTVNDLWKIENEISKYFHTCSISIHMVKIHGDLFSLEISSNYWFSIIVKTKTFEKHHQMYRFTKTISSQWKTPSSISVEVLVVILSCELMMVMVVLFGKRSFLANRYGK